MAKKTATKKTTKKAAKKTAKKAVKKDGAATALKGKDAAGPTRTRGKGLGYRAGVAKGKSLVIVESPSKAKTINKYLGNDYIVLASVGHVRDLPSKSPKGVKAPVPGVDLERRFTPTYQVLDGKEAVVRDLKKAAKDVISTGGQVWFATDLDREGEAIAWHIAQEIGIDPLIAKRVVFAAITKNEIARAFTNPHAINVDRVNAQQARRILDRIVGYQVSPLLWKKVARGLSAGRVQSVAVRLVVEREREIKAFVPDEYWSVNANFALSIDQGAKLGPQWAAFLKETDEKGNTPTVKSQNAWLAGHQSIRAELVEIAGEKFDINAPGDDVIEPIDLSERVAAVARAIGLTGVEIAVTEDPTGRGPARFRRTVVGTMDPTTPYAVRSIETKRTSSRPSAPFITSTMQQAASTRLGFGAQRTMRAAQQLYEGIDIPGEGPTGLITYMRTDSTHLAQESIDAARGYINRTFGDAYLPAKPNVYKSSNKGAQEAHEAIRPTDPSRTPDSLKKSLKPDQHRLYDLIWRRFVSCQMTPAQWDATAVLIDGGNDTSASSGTICTFKATGRTLVFDGFYRVAGVPTSTDEATLPKLEERQPLAPFHADVLQKFTAPPPRYSEASLIKQLESEGIGRPSTYASIVQVIQDRRYAEQIDRRFYATDLGEVVTDKLIEAFPKLMDVGYTREMETKLDQIEEDHLDWIEMLEQFYGRFKQALERAEAELGHAKAEIQPSDHTCPECGKPMVYRFGKNGRFLSCGAYPDCSYACPIDRQGNPMPAEFVNVRCPKTGRPMEKKTGRFGPFITTLLEKGEENDVGIILNLDKTGHVTAPSVPALETELPCPTCQSPLNLRDGLRGPWLGCSRFPKCRGRGKWTELDDATRTALEQKLEAHLREHPIPIIETYDGQPLTDEKGKPRKDAPTIDQLIMDHDPREAAAPRA